MAKTAQTEEQNDELSSQTIMQQLLDEVKRMRAEQEETKAQFERELAAARAESAEAKQAAIDAFQPQPMADWIDPRSDHPATIEEKLFAMERQAKENEQPFDKERTRRVLMGLPVEDLNKWVYMGHAFDTEEEMEAYKLKVTSERERTVGRYPR